MSGDGWRLSGAARDSLSITKDWQLVGQQLLSGVVVREISNVCSGYGRLTEIYRSEWDSEPADQVFQSILEPGATSAWHAHERTLDRLFCAVGRLLIVLFDARAESPTRGQLNVFRIGEHRPAVIRVPPQVWHGVKNIGSVPSLLVNVVDRAYQYENPDHYRVPVDSAEIPFDIVHAS